MKHHAILLAAVLLSFCCARETGRSLMGEEELEMIRAGLASAACLARIDSLCFEIGGILYRTDPDDGRFIVELLPDTLPACPLSGLEYLLTETEREVTVACPSGHGFQTVKK